MNRIEGPAQARALLQADPAMAVNAAMLLGKHVKPAQGGKSLAKSQLAAWDGFCANLGKQSRPKKRR